jgi:opacity protein-like surface antigen
MTFSLPITNTITPYAVVGYTKIEATASASGYSATASDSDKTLAFGINYDVNDSWLINAEFAQLVDDVDSVTVGVRLGF